MCTAACKRRETIALELICCQWLGIGIYAGSVPINMLSVPSLCIGWLPFEEREKEKNPHRWIPNANMCDCRFWAHTHSEHNHFTIRLHLNAHKWRVSTAAVRFQSYNIIRTHVRWKSNRPNEHTQRTAAHVVRLLCGIQMSANWALTVGLDKFCIHHSFGSHKRRRLVSPLYLSISLSLHILDAHFAQWTMDGSAKLLQILYLNENWIQF